MNQPHMRFLGDNFVVGEDPTSYVILVLSSWLIQEYFSVQAC